MLPGDTVDHKIFYQGIPGGITDTSEIFITSRPEHWIKSPHSSRRSTLYLFLCMMLLKAHTLDGYFLASKESLVIDVGNRSVAFLR